jgi:hypothetical protein
VAGCLVGFHASVWIPAETAGEEIEEWFIIAFENLLEAFG